MYIYDNPLYAVLYFEVRDCGTPGVRARIPTIEFQIKRCVIEFPQKCLHHELQEFMFPSQPSFKFDIMAAHIFRPDCTILKER